MIEIVEFVNVIYLCYVFLKVKVLKLINKK